MDICYIPMVQSGGVYDLRPSAPNTDDHLHYGVIVCALGARHRSYCSNVARTFMVDPSPEQKKAYNALLAAQVRRALSAANALPFPSRALPVPVGHHHTARVEPGGINSLHGVVESTLFVRNAWYSAVEVPTLPGTLHWRQCSVPIVRVCRKLAVMGTHQRFVCASSQAAAIAALKPGAPMSAAMEAAIKSLEETPDAAIKALAGKLTKNVGFGMGLEFRDSTAVLNLKNQGEVKAGMVFNVMVGATDPCSKETDSKQSSNEQTWVENLPPANGASAEFSCSVGSAFRWGCLIWRTPRRTTTRAGRTHCALRTRWW